jgi:5-methylcytosine-specific restriction endonuclease McrA
VSGWGGRRVTELRKAMAHLLPCVCWRCGQRITEDMQWTIGHIIDRDIAPELTWEPSNHRPEHARCNFSAGGKAGRRKQMARRPRRARTAPVSREW